MKINEDLVKYNILPESLAKNLLILAFENFLLKGKYSYKNDKPKNEKFLEFYDFGNIDEAIDLFYSEIDFIDIEYAYEYYIYLRGERQADARTRTRIGNMSVKDRIKLPSRYAFVCNMPKCIENRHIFGKKDKKMYICIDTENPKEPKLFSFHEIPKGDKMPDEDMYDYRVGIWKLTR